MTAAPSATSVEAAMEPLWRSVAVFRFAAWVYVVVAYVLLDEYFTRQELGWVVVVLMGVWSVLISAIYAKPAGRRATFVVIDVLVSCLAVLATSWVDDPLRIDAGEPTLALVWPVAGVLAAAAFAGLLGGTLAALAVSSASMFARGEFAWTTARNIILLMVTGVVVGYTVDLFRRSQYALVEALRLQAASVERERLARSVHDGVLQVLSLVQRQAGDLGGTGPQLAEMAGKQELALRSLISQPTTPTGPSDIDLAAALAVLESPDVTVSRPADPFVVPAHLGTELVAAVQEALANIRQHAGANAHAWILLDAHSGGITISVRDDGVGIPDGRLAEAAASGRLGIASSIEGRIADLGGSVSITSVAGAGTEIEMHVPMSA